MAFKILNLYSGLGGNRKLWKNCKITSVESDQIIANQYREFYPEDELIISDAHEYLLENYQDFDFIWSSPPCQSHSKMMKATRHKKKKYPDMKLYEEIIFLKNFFKGKFIIENVKPYYETLIKPDQIIERHIFWSNFDFPNIQIPNISNFINRSSTNEKKNLMDWLDIHYKKNIYYENNHDPAQVLRNSVHPKIGEHIMNFGRI